MHPRLILLLFLIPFFPDMALSNNIRTSNVGSENKNTTSDFVFIRFDLNWENSWRTSSAPSNWDAAWVFVKFRIGTGPWKHASLYDSGNSAGTGTPAKVQVGLLDEASVFNATTNPGIGAFFYRSADGSGPFAITGARLKWNYGADGVSDASDVEVMLVAVEMVCVPSGSFYVGSGGNESASFTKANSTTGNTVPFEITAGPITLQGNDAASSASNLSARSGGWDLTGTNTAVIPSAYPTGYAGFYCMKYEISQQQYVDFLNTLTATQKSARYSGSSSNRNGISSSGGVYSTTLPDVARNFMTWPDGAAYSDWSCLRPMTELEFEKACRGSASPVASEYAWGTAAITANKYLLTNAGMPDENITAATFSTTDGNGITGENTSSSSPFQGNLNGPLRVGIFAGNPLNASRVTSGASYYGILELSGNLYELCVSLGMSSGSTSLGIGRNFTGLHGNGSLASAGTADVANWPANTVSAGSGIIFRGGHWNNYATFLRVSDRAQAYGSNPGAFRHAGYRAVRSLPASAAE